MINVAKNKQEKCQPSPLRHTSTPFKNFSDPPFRERQLKFTPPFFEKERGQSELWYCTHFVFDFIRVALFHMAVFSSCIFFALYPVHVAPFCVQHYSHVALFLCCTLFKFHFFVLQNFRVALFRIALFSFCTIFKQHLFRVVLILRCTFSVLYFFHFALFSCRTFFRVALFSCCTFCALFSCYTFFFVVHFSCCTFSILHFFHVELFSCCTFFTLYRFHAAPFCLSRSFHVPPFLVLPHVVLFKHSGQQFY